MMPAMPVVMDIKTIKTFIDHVLQRFPYAYDYHGRRAQSYSDYLCYLFRCYGCAGYSGDDDMKTEIDARLDALQAEINEYRAETKAILTDESQTQTITLYDEAGAVVCQINVRNVRSDLDFERTVQSIADCILFGLMVS